MTGRPWREIDTVAWSRQWDCLHREVRDFFDGRPNFLELNLPAGDGWDKLCPFLQRPRPADEFPRCNTGRERLRQVMELYEPTVKVF